MYQINELCPKIKINPEISTLREKPYQFPLFQTFQSHCARAINLKIIYWKEIELQSFHDGPCMFVEHRCVCFSQYTMEINQS